MLKPLSNTLQSVILFTWPMVFISMIIMVTFRLCYLIKNKEKIVVYKEVSMLIFGIYILCLFQVVTFQDDTSWASNNFIPLKEILRYNNMSRLFIKNVLGNMIMFLPFGFFTICSRFSLQLLSDEEKHNKGVGKSPTTVTSTFI